MSDIVERLEERIRCEPTLKTLQVLQDSVAEIILLRVELAEARDKALDEAATELERLDGHGEWHECAQAIRALKSPKPPIL